MGRASSSFWRTARAAMAAAALAAGFAAGPAQAQIGVDRPGRIALVLSGGGAAGAAHVGVIRALEEVGLRPDCVAGTSMGAIVGGLYASGKSVQEMEQIVSDIDWFAILDDTADRGLLHPMRRRPRNDPRAFLNTLPVGADEGSVRTDAGLVDGNRLLLILRELTLDTAGVRNFDRFDLPFRAVATDLATGDAVELKEGDLAVALRASMSLPGLFPPIVQDDMVLVDGGVANNLPIDVGRKLCASGENDRVIAVTIPQSKPDVKNLTTLTGAVGQTLSLLIRSSTDKQLELNPPGSYELLTPAVNDIGTIDFPKVPEAMQIGYDSTIEDVRALAAKMRGQAQQMTAFSAAPAPGVGRARGGIAVTGGGLGELLDVSSIAIENDTRYSDEVIRSYLDLTPPTTISTLELSERLERLYGLGAFDLVSYRFETGGRLVVIAKKRQAGPIEFRIGAASEDSFDGRATYSFGGGVSFTQLDELGLRVDIDAAIGSRQLAAVAVEQPLTPSQRWFLTGELEYYGFRAPVNVSPEDRRADYFLRTAQAGVDISYAPLDTLRFSAGPSYRWRRGELSTGDPDQFPANTQSDTAGGRFAISLDTLDDQVLPRSGISLDTDLYIEGEPAFSGEFAGTLQIDALAAYPLPFGSAVHAFVRGGGELGQSDERIGFNPVGGFQRLSGFERDAFTGDIAGVVGLRGITQSSLIEGLSGLEGFAGASIEYGGFWDQWSEVGQDNGFLAGSVFAGVNTRLGPLYLGFGYAETGSNAIYLGFGERF